MKVTKRPVPVPDQSTKPFWDAVQQRQLVIQRCQACKRYSHPPVSYCQNCGSRDLRFEAVSGRGAIYSFTIVSDTRLKGFEEVLPYQVVLVELTEQRGLLMTVNMADTPVSGLRIGAPVLAHFIEVENGVVLPEFLLAE